MCMALRFSLSLLLLVTISNAQDTCSVESFAGGDSIDGLHSSRGVVRTTGSLRTNVWFFQPVATTRPRPPVLLSYSEIQLAESRTKLIGVGIELAKAGAFVMLLERSLVWEAQNHPVDRDPRMLDCASDWLVSQKNLDLLHTTYVGPKVQDETGKPRYPSGFAHAPQPRRGDLWFPLGETQDGNTKEFMQFELCDRLISSIEQHWLVVIEDSEKASSK